jgi:hypothetical protein
MAASKEKQGGDVMRKAMLIAVMVIAATMILALNKPAITAPQNEAAVRDIISRNMEAAVGADALARVKAVSFAGRALYMGASGLVALGEHDSNLDLIRNEPRFQALLKRLE